MKTLNNNVVLKLIPQKKKKGDIFEEEESSPEVFECEVIHCDNISLIGKSVLIGKYSGVRYKDYIIVPFSTLLIEI